jgi:hypothetical protein
MAAIANWGDLDNDGTRDVVVALLENFSHWPWWKALYNGTEDRFTWDLIAHRNADRSNHWLQAGLSRAAGNPQAIGARVTVRTSDSQQLREVGSGEGALFSQGEYPLYFGLGPHHRVDELRVRWPDGSSQVLRDIVGDRLLVIDRASSP